MCTKTRPLMRLRTKGSRFSGRILSKTGINQYYCVNILNDYNKLSNQGRQLQLKQNIMHTMLERQRLTNKRLSQNREKLKQYCGQLNLERIPENTGGGQSPRDQAQILLGSYRTQRQEFQLSQPNKDYSEKYMSSTAFQKESSLMTLGSGSIATSPKYPNTDRLRYKSLSNQLGDPNKQMLLTRYGGDTTSRIETDGDTKYQHFTIKLKNDDPTREYFSRAKKLSPRLYEEGTGKMSPLSQVKQLLKHDVGSIKHQANQTFFNHLTKQQISLHEQGAKNKEYIDPLSYYESRYFPLGFDDPEKLHQYLLHHRPGKQEHTQTESQIMQSEEAALRQIKQYELQVNEAVGKRIESTIEADFDRRNQMESDGGRYKQQRKVLGGTLESNRGFIEKYLSSAGLSSKGSSTILQKLPEKMSKEKHILSKSLVRGGLSMVSASLPMSPGLNQWAASGVNLSSYAKKPGLSGVRQGITSGETVLLGELIQPQTSTSRAQIHATDPPMQPNPIMSVDQRNTSLTKMRSESSTNAQSQAFRTLRRSRDLREELINQRMLTSQRLEAMNIKVPTQWRLKEQAYFRFKDMKNQMLSSSKVGGENNSLLRGDVTLQQQSPMHTLGSTSISLIK